MCGYLHYPARADFPVDEPVEQHGRLGVISRGAGDGRDSAVVNDEREWAMPQDDWVPDVSLLVRLYTFKYTHRLIPARVALGDRGSFEPAARRHRNPAAERGSREPDDGPDEGPTASTPILASSVAPSGGPATLAFQTKVNVLPVITERYGARIDLRMLEPLDPADYCDLRSLRVAVARTFESFVLAKPEIVEVAWSPSPLVTETLTSQAAGAAGDVLG